MMLEQFNDQYAGTEAATNKFDKIPDGDYEVEVTSCAVAPNEFDPSVIQLQWAFRLDSGRFCWKNDNIEAKRLPYIKKDLETMGLALEKFSDLEKRASELEGSRVKIHVKNNYVEERDKTYTNVYINELIAAPEPVAADVADDDVPF